MTNEAERDAPMSGILEGEMMFVGAAGRAVIVKRGIKEGGETDVGGGEGMKK